MQVSVEEQDKFYRVVTVTVPAADIKKAVRAATAKIAPRARVQGFRKGHLPEDVLVSMYGETIGRQALEDLYRNTIFPELQKTVKSSEYYGNPVVENPDDVKPDADYACRLKVCMIPQVDAGKIDGAELQVPVCSISDADMDEMVMRLRKSRRMWRDVDGMTAEDGRRVSFSSSCTDGSGKTVSNMAAENLDLVLGEGRLPFELEKELRGHKAGDEIQTTRVTNTEQTVPGVEPGTELHCVLKVSSVAEEVLPEVDEAFIKGMGIKDGSVDKMHEALRNMMNRQAEQAVNLELQQRVLKVIDSVYGEFEVPKEALDEAYEIANIQLGRSLVNQGYTKPQIEKIMAKRREMPRDENAERTQARHQAIFANLRRRFGISEASRDEILAEVSKAAADYEKPEEFVKQMMKDRAAVGQFADQVRLDKLLEAIKSVMKVTEEPMEFFKLTEKLQM